MSTPQPGILDDVPAAARYLTFTLSAGADPRAALRALARLADGSATVVGIGRALVHALERELPELHPYPHIAPGVVELPATPAALWCWLRGEDRGELVHRARAIVQALAPAFACSEAMDAFRYDGGRDLSGYIDGTANPAPELAPAVAFHPGGEVVPAGSSFVAVQRWVHDLGRLAAMPQEERDARVGRRQADNEEIDDAPDSAHVKRTAQELFAPEAFVLRRSMPWNDGVHAGLVFVAFGCTLDAFEAQLQRMTGGDDGIVDGLFGFTRPVTGSYFWCPPLQDGKLDLRAIGL